MLASLGVHAAPPGHSGKSYKKSFIPFVVLSPEAIEMMKSVSGYWVEVQVPQRKLLLAKGSHLIKSFSIAVGEPEFPTPEGARKINTVIWNPWWYPPPESKWVTDPTPVPPRTPENPLGEIKMPLGDSYLIHGTRAVDSIGRWASHGCIRMIYEDLFGVVQIIMSGYSKVNAVTAMEQANQDINKQFHTSLDKAVPVILTYNPVQVSGEKVQISPDFYKKIPDMNQLVVDTLEPHLSKDQSPHLKKIASVLRQLKHDTVQIPLENLVSDVSVESKVNDEAYLERKKKQKERQELLRARQEELQAAREEREELRKQRALQRQEARNKVQNDAQDGTQNDSEDDAIVRPKNDRSSRRVPSKRSTIKKIKEEEAQEESSQE